MKSIILATALFLAFPMNAFAQTIKSTSDIEQNFVEKYVKAINSRDIFQLKLLMHPSNLICINPITQEYFQDLFERPLRDTVPEKYIYKIEPLSKTDKEALKKEIWIGKKLGLNYPVDTTHRLQLDFKPNNNLNSAVTIVRYLTQKGNQFYEVYACPSEEWMQAYHLRKTVSQEQTKYSQKLTEAAAEYDRAVPKEERKSFAKDEVGVIYWEDQGEWKYNWEFKSRPPFKLVQIVMISHDGKEKVLVDHKTMTKDFPVTFGFRLNDPRFFGEGQNAHWSIAYGYSREGEHPMGLADWVDLADKNLRDVHHHSNASNVDLFKASGEIILATYETSDSSRDLISTIKIKYETQ